MEPLKHARWRGVALPDVSIDAGFWAERQRTNRDASLPHGFRMLRESGNLWNLQLAAGQATGEYRGPLFMDSDVYKWLEAVGYAMRGGLAEDVRAAADATIALIEAAQRPDGYLDSYYQVVAPSRRWLELNTGHELYCAGHLAQAAIAWQRYANDERLLNVVRRLFAHVASVFGPGKRVGVPGHPEVEMALVELYRLSQERSYLELAQFFVDHRGYGHLGERYGGAAYFQDRVPVRDAVELEGHAVRALYLNCGVTDLYLETGEQALLDAMSRQWTDLVAHKLYITGGTGSRHTGESFGHPYELPNERAYCETCAAIASIMWSWRLLLTTGESRFADLIERTLYNGFLSGVSLDGTRFFYVNPLLSRGRVEVVGRGVVQRQPWFTVACCPPNIMRTLASLQTLVASSDAEGIQVHQYMPCSIRVDNVALRMATDYPWHGRIEVSIQDTPHSAWTLQLRRPVWAPSASLALNGVAVDPSPADNGYLRLRRTWSAGDHLQVDFPMSPRLSEPHPRIESSHTSVAIERGPLVYCVEQSDHPHDDVLDLALDLEAPLREGPVCDELGGALTLRARGKVADAADWPDATFRPLRRSVGRRRGADIVAIPYYAWGHRSPGAMRVWLRRDQDQTLDAIAAPSGA